MNTFNVIFTVAVLLFMTYSMTSATPCSSNDQCFFGSICDQVSGICKCGTPCNDFNKDLVCTNKRRIPFTRCQAINRACELQQFVKIIPFNFAVYIANGKSCGKVHRTTSESVETICKDQSLCFREGGVCLEKNGERACRCNPNFSGLRCDNRIPIISASRDDQPDDIGNINVVSNQGPEINDQISIGKSLIIGKVAPYAALAILSCMLCCCFVARHYRRRKSENESEIEIDATIEKQQPQSAENKPQTTELKLKTTDKNIEPVERKLSSRCDNIDINISRKNSLSNINNDVCKREFATVQVEINQTTSV